MAQTDVPRVTIYRVRQVNTVKPFNAALERVQSAADNLAARCSMYEHVLAQESAVVKLEKAVAELRRTLDVAKAAKI